MTERPEVQVTDNAAAGRYEAHVNGALAGYIRYRELPGEIVLIHTEVDDEYEGQGVGSRLVAGALDDVRARGLFVTPLCRFASAYIDRHPEYEDLLAA